MKTQALRGPWSLFLFHKYVPCNHKAKVQIHVSCLYEGGTHIKSEVHCFKCGHRHDCPAIWNHCSSSGFSFSLHSLQGTEKEKQPLSLLDIPLRSLCCMRILSKVACGGYTWNYVCAASFRRDLGLSHCLWLSSGSEASIHWQCFGFQRNGTWTQRLRLWIYEDAVSKINLETTIVNHHRAIYLDFWLFSFPSDIVYLF